MKDVFLKITFPEMSKDREMLVEIALRELQNAKIEIVSEASPTGLTAKDPQDHIPETKTKDDSTTANLELLEAAGLTNHRVVILTNRLLDLHTDDRRLKEDEARIMKAADEWSERMLDNDIWGLFIERVSLTKDNPHWVILGLNKKNQYQILFCAQGTTLHEAIKSILSRGVTASSIKFAIVKREQETDSTLKQNFPKIKIGYDWLSIIASLPAGQRKTAKRAMVMTDESKARNAIKNLKLPQELLTHFEFKPDLWRAMRSLSPIIRLKREIAGIVQDLAKRDYNQSQRQTIIPWVLLKYQYQWSKIPVDAKQLNNLKYIKSLSLED